MNAELVTALIKARQEFPDIPKTKEGMIGNRKFMYADLADILFVVTPILNKNGVLITQCLTSDGPLRLVTTLIHKNGSHLDSVCYIPYDQQTQMKDFGGFLTYIKRYALCGILGVHPDDDADAQDLEPMKPGFKPKPISQPFNKASTNYPKPKQGAAPIMSESPSKQAESDADFDGFPL